MEMLLRNAGQEKAKPGKKQSARHGEQSSKDKLYCAYCGQAITDMSMAISVAGDHEHTFTNPSGFVYSVQCFSSAAGCIAVGRATAEHTWFAGYEWQLALCQSCQNHLGWYFINADTFFALIRGRLTGSP